MNPAKQTPGHYAKFLVAILGAGLTAALGILSPDTDLFAWVTVASAMVTAAGVYLVPNKDTRTNA